MWGTRGHLNEGSGKKGKKKYNKTTTWNVTCELVSNERYRKWQEAQDYRCSTAWLVEEASTPKMTAIEYRIKIVHKKECSEILHLTYR